MAVLIRDCLGGGYEEKLPYVMCLGPKVHIKDPFQLQVHTLYVPRPSEVSGFKIYVE